MSRFFFSNNAASLDSNFPISVDVPVPSVAEIKHFSLGILERTLAVTFLVLLSPFFLVLAIVGKAISHGPVFYSQIRVGKYGKLFSIFKFRTMVLQAESKTGAVLSWAGDPRVTPWGSLLRKTHLDELPQLANVALGEMSFIGPRPERPEFVNQFKEVLPNYSVRLRVKPGITGLAQICCPYDVAPAEKLKFDLISIANRSSLRMHLFILWRTMAKMLLVRIF